MLTVCVSREANVGWVVVVLLVGACGPSSHVDGRIAGQTLEVAEAFFLDAPQENGKPLRIVLSDTAGLCAAYKAGKGIKNAKFLNLMLANAQGTTPGAGTYAIGPTAGAGFYKTDGNCGTVTVSSAASGQVTLDAIEVAPSGRARGGFSLSFPPTPEVTGQFNSEYCQLTWPALPGNCGP